MLSDVEKRTLQQQNPKTQSVQQKGADCVTCTAELIAEHCLEMHTIMSKIDLKHMLKWWKTVVFAGFAIQYLAPIFVTSVCLYSVCALRLALVAQCVSRHVCHGNNY